MQNSFLENIQKPIKGISRHCAFCSTNPSLKDVSFLTKIARDSPRIVYLRFNSTIFVIVCTYYCCAYLISI